MATGRLLPPRQSSTLPGFSSSVVVDDRDVLELHRAVWWCYDEPHRAVLEIYFTKCFSRKAVPEIIFSEQIGQSMIKKV